MPELEERQAKIEGILEQIDKHIGPLEGEFRSEITQVRNEVSQLRNENSQTRNEILSFFKWIIGIMVTMWITIIITILLKT